MKRHYGIIITGVIVLVVLIALSAAGTVTLDRPPEDEFMPLRSTYNTGPTGTRAFYQLLEESGYQVERWRENYRNLNLSGSNAKDAAFVVVAPFPYGVDFDNDEATALQNWVTEGGKLLLISRTPQAVLRNARVTTNTKNENSFDLKNAKPADLIATNNDALIAQPTALTRNVRGLALSKLAGRLQFRAPSENLATEEKTDADNEDENEKELIPPPPPPPPKPTVTSQAQNEEENQAAATPTAKVRATPTPRPIPDGVPGSSLIVTPPVAPPSAPVVHLGDKDGAALIEFKLGKGQMILLSDPFVIANNGIAEGSNLQLALNLIEALGGNKQKIFFDEYHHGYHSQGNAMLNYFRGTPVPLIFFQLLFVALILTYSYGKRFARALPMPTTDRHSPLEFVGSMASLQQAAQARDLALENIYPRFKNKICRHLGLPITASPNAIVARLKQRGRVTESEVELLRVFSESESVLKGKELDDQRLIDLVAIMRRITAQIK